MLDLKGYVGIALMKGDDSLESNKIMIYCYMKNIPLIRISKNEKCPDDYIPSGSVEWCLLSLEKRLILDQYPTWLVSYISRKIWITDKFPLIKNIFIKPADRYKRFKGFITTGTYKGKKKPPYYCSDVVTFINEWRYYVTNGQMISSDWYWGDDINIPNAPILNLNIPNDWSGTIDMGQLDNGQLELVECHHPFACGWYGHDIEKYLQWIIDGWIYMKIKA